MTMSDTVQATEKLLADKAPFAKVKFIRSDNSTEFVCKDFENSNKYKGH